VFVYSYLIHLLCYGLIEQSYCVCLFILDSSVVLWPYRTKLLFPVMLSCGYTSECILLYHNRSSLMRSACIMLLPSGQWVRVSTRPSSINR